MYELVFWKYLEGIYLNHHEVYEAIIEEQAEIEGLEQLPVQVGFHPGRGPAGDPRRGPAGQRAALAADLGRG